MLCPNCGKKNQDGSRYCKACGARLTTAGRKSSASAARSERRQRNRAKAVVVLFFVEAILMVASLVVLAAAYRANPDSGHIAEQYVKASERQDWGAVYELLSIDDTSAFMGKQAYVNACTVNQSVQEGDGAQAASSVEIEKLEKTSEDTSTQVYHVTYLRDGSAAETDVTLVKKNVRWKVQMETEIVRGFSLSVPKGATLSVDNIEVSAEMKRSEEDANRDVYTIARVFGATHYVTVGGDGFETTARLVTASEDGSTVRVDAGYDETQTQEFAQSAFEDLNTILTAAVNDKNYSSVAILKGMQSKKKDELLEAYKTVKDEIFYNDSENQHLVDFQMTDCSAAVKTNAGDSKNLVRVTIDGAYTMRVFDEENDEELQTESGTCSHRLTYKYSNGDWTLYSGAFEFTKK